MIDPPDVDPGQDQTVGLSREERLGHLRDSIARFAAMPGECDACERKSYHAFCQEFAEANPGYKYTHASPFPVDLEANGWCHMPHAAGAIRHCATCLDKRPNAWALKVDLERALDWADRVHPYHAWPLADLKELL